MKMKIAIVFFSLLLITCNKEVQEKDCIGEVLIDCLCTEEYQPVCGCDGITYGNACFATCAGVKEVSSGECPVSNERLIGKWKFLGWQYESSVDIFKPATKHNFAVQIEFTEEIQQGGFKKFQGKSAVNSYGGGYQVGVNNALNFNALSSTKIAGNTQQMQFELDYFNSLNDVTRFRIVNGLLLLETITNGKTDFLVYQRL